MIKEEDIKVGLRFYMPFDDCQDVFGGVILGGYVSNQFIYLSVREKLGGDMWQVEVMDRKNRGTLLPICEMDISNGGEYWQAHNEGGTALNYMNDIREKAIKSDGVRQFESIISKMLDTYKVKNHDYGNAFSEMYDELGINYGYGKIREKVSRIKTLKDKDAQVENEPLEDALLDAANYCILTLMEYQKCKSDGKM